MTPEVRSIADRFILDTANVKYLASVLPKGGLDRMVSDWTVRQVLAHVAASNARYGEWSAAFIDRGELPADFDPRPFNDRTAAANRKTKLPVILARLDAGLIALVDILGRMPEDAGDRQFGRVSLGVGLRAWVSHAAVHGLEIVEAVEELRMDPMLLNWLLYADVSNSPEAVARQQRLLSEVREHLRADGDDWDSESGWEEGDDDAL